MGKSAVSVCGVALAAVATLCTTLPAGAQHVAMPEAHVAVSIDSGTVAADESAADRGVIWSDVVRAPGATSMRLLFDVAKLGEPAGDGRPTVLRITAPHDGAHQQLDAQALRQWSYTSAYFNGDTLLVELIADPTAGPSRVRATEALIALPDDAGERTICGPTDDRVPSSDPRVGRVIPNGCTAWIIDDARHCLLTAGHCASASIDVIEFNVPLSDDEGVRQHAHPDDQYVVDPTSVQRQSTSVGNDWAYFGCFANPNTGLTPYEAQGASFVLAASPPDAAGQTLRVTGHGVTDDSVPPQWNRAQKTHTGAYEAHVSNALQYTVDTTGGNSGSPIIDEASGMAIGIHTHGGCGSGGGFNQGTAIDHPNLVNALNNPLGVCAPPGPSLAFSFPKGAAELIDPAGDMITVVIEGVTGGTLDDTTPTLHYSTGSGYIPVAMTENEQGDFEAVFPAITCGTVVRYYVSAQTVGGVTVTSPADAPDNTYRAITAAALNTAFFDTGETDPGWSVEDDGSLEGGTWQRGIPAGGGDRGDPRLDFDDPSLQCWLTENVNGDSDVDGGPTRLISPAVDLSTFADPQFEYAIWFFTDEVGGPDFDRIEMHFSDDDGKTWTFVRSETSPAGWLQRVIRIADYVAPTSEFRVRFSAFDVPNNSIVEAAVDAIHIFDIECTANDPTDLNDDGVTDVFDLFLLLGAWGPCPGPCPPSCPADINGDCTVDVFDLFEVLAAWG